MYRLPEAFTNLINQLSELPGIGRKTAQRLAFFLRDHQALAGELEDAIGEFAEEFARCQDCGALIDADKELCQVCADEERDRTTLCVVESQKDMMAFEENGGYQGLYHILGGTIDPSSGTAPQDLNIAELASRIRNDGIEEVILATNPTVAGKTTAEYIQELLQDDDVEITRIAHGLPFGGEVEYADKQTLKQALKGRHKV